MTKVKNQPQQLHELLIEHNKQQDHILNQADEVIGKAILKHKNINKQLNEQEQILDDLNKRLSDTNKNVSKINMNMEDFLNRTSNSCLYTVIAIADFIFLLLISI